MSNRSDYSLGIWKAWEARRGPGGPEMSSAEWSLACNWHDQGIPFRVVLQAITDLASCPGPRTPLSYATRAVDEEWTRVQRGRSNA